MEIILRYVNVLIVLLGLYLLNFKWKKSTLALLLTIGSGVTIVWAVARIISPGGLDVIVHWPASLVFFAVFCATLIQIWQVKD